MGVSLALQKLNSALAQNTYKRIFTLGPLIHNPQVLAEYEAKGVACIDEHVQLEAGDCVVIRAHGIPRDKEEAIRASGAHVIDATCPKVKKAQLAIAKATMHGASLLLFGEADHPEVRGLVSYAKGASRVLGADIDLSQPLATPANGFVLASQTTQDREAFLKLEARMTALYPHLKVLSTICDATKERQEEAKAIAKRVDIMVVVGGKQSGNTRRLADVAASCGIETLHVETATELDDKKFEKKLCVGLTAGASTPKSVIDAAEEKLAAL